MMTWLMLYSLVPCTTLHREGVRWFNVVVESSLSTSSKFEARGNVRGPVTAP